MATIDLSLDALKIPALDNFTPDFGTMITETQANKGGLSTFEVNANMMMPWAYMRPKVVTENSTTTVVEYDAKLTFSASLQAGVALSMDAGDYEGCEVSLRNLSSYACTVGHGTFSLEIPAGGFVRIIWNGTTWEADVSSAVGSGIILPPTAAAVHAAIGGIKLKSKSFISLKDNVGDLTVDRTFTVSANGLVVVHGFKINTGHTVTLILDNKTVDANPMYGTASGPIGFTLQGYATANTSGKVLCDGDGGNWYIQKIIVIPMDIV